MLRATRELLRYGGRTAFTVIEMAPGLTSDERAQVLDAVPPAVETTRSYPALLHAVGFRHLVAIDLTSEYAATVSRWLTAYGRHREALVALDGEEEVATRMTGWTSTLEAVANGWLRRLRYSGTAS